MSKFCFASLKFIEIIIELEKKSRKKLKTAPKIYYEIKQVYKLPKLATFSSFYHQDFLKKLSINLPPPCSMKIENGQLIK